MTNTSYRLGVVSFLNSRPLIHGLTNRLAGVEIVYDVPAALPEKLDLGDVDVALVPVIDFVQPRRSWSIVSDACIGCDGESLTVRVFSRVPPAEIRTLHVDGDSHTSVVLASLIWRRAYGTKLNIVPYPKGMTERECEAILLIGDKVINHGLVELDLATDLGGAWKSLTGLPFVFAVWAAKTDRELGELPDILRQARNHGVANVDHLAEHVAPGLGWPIELARRYLGRRLVYTMDERQREGLSLFLELAASEGLLPAASRLVYA